jgi:ferritin-like metal-binding protein YciE
MPTTKSKYGTNGSGSTNGSSKKPGTVSTNWKKTWTLSNKSIEDIFVFQLHSIFNAEMQLLNALPKFAKSCDSEELQESFENSLEHTRKQVERIEKIYDRLGISRETTITNNVMEVLVEETFEVIEEFPAGPVRDSAVIIATQKIEHYEIASYGSLRELAEVMGYHKIATLLDRSLHEEGQTEHILSQIAMDVNDEACSLVDFETQGTKEYSWK